MRVFPNSQKFEGEVKIFRKLAKGYMNSKDFYRFLAKF